MANASQQPRQQPSADTTGTSLTRSLHHDATVTSHKQQPPPVLASLAPSKAIEKFLRTAEFAIQFPAPLDIASLDSMIPISPCYDLLPETTGAENSLGILDVLKGIICVQATDASTGDRNHTISIIHTLPLQGYNFFCPNYTDLFCIRDNATLSKQVWAYGAYCVQHQTYFPFVIKVCCGHLTASSSWTGGNFDHIAAPSFPFPPTSTVPSPAVSSLSPAFGSPSNSTSPNGNFLSHRFIYDSSIPTLVSHSTPVSLDKTNYTYSDKPGFAPSIQHTKTCLGSSHIPQGRLVPTPSPVSVSLCQLQADTIDSNGPLHTDVSHPDSFVPADSNVVSLSDTGDPAASNDKPLSDTGNHDPFWTVDTVAFTSMTPDQLQHFQQQGLDSSDSVDEPSTATGDLAEHWAAETVEPSSWTFDQLQAFQQSVPTDSLGHGSSVSPGSFVDSHSATEDPAALWTADTDDYDDYNSWTSDQLQDSWTSDQTQNF
jgi:hypothetical protein